MFWQSVSFFWRIILGLLFIGVSTSASELQIYSAEFEPFTYLVNENGKDVGQGVMYEVVSELSRRVGSSKGVQFLPWNRIKVLAAQNKNVGLIPLARVPERENEYTWLAHILNDPYVVFKMRDSKIDISSIAALRKARVGIFMGSLAEIYMKKHKIPNYRSSPKDIQNVKMLKSGRIDAWVAPLSFRKVYAEKVGINTEDLVVGMELTLLHEYLAASKDLEASVAKKWQLAFVEMKKDGSYEAIMKKYGVAPIR